MLLSGCMTSYITPSTELQFDKDNYLILSKSGYQHYLEPGKIVITAELPKGKKGSFSYWPANAPEKKITTVIDSTWDRLHHRQFLVVDPSEKYLAQIEIEGYKTRLISLLPQAKRGEDVTFLVAGDSRAPNAKDQIKIVNQMNKEDASLYVHLGDMVTYGDSVKEWDAFFHMQKTLLEKMLFLPVIGNHDLEWGNFLNWLFHEEDQYVTPPRYYASSHGDVYFIMLDSTADIVEGDAQYNFLIDHLEKTKKENFSHTFISLHHPAYSSGWHKGNKNILEVVTPVAEQYGVRAIFAGHEHHYERTKKINGVTHFVSGGAGSKLRKVKGNENTAFAKSIFHYLRVTVTGSVVNIKAIDQGGEVIDDVTL